MWASGQTSNVTAETIAHMVRKTIIYFLFIVKTRTIIVARILFSFLVQPTQRILPDEARVNARRSEHVGAGLAREETS